MFGKTNTFADLIEFTDVSISRFPPSGLEDWSDRDVLAQVLAASQQEYFDSLKKKTRADDGSPRSGSPDSQ